MQRHMQRNAAVYRTEKTLQEGCDRIDEVYESFKDVKITDKGLVWNTDLIETLELENLLRKYYHEPMAGFSIPGQAGIDA